MGSNGNLIRLGRCHRQLQAHDDEMCSSENHIKGRLPRQRYAVSSGHTQLILHDYDENRVYVLCLEEVRVVCIGCGRKVAI